MLPQLLNFMRCAPDFYFDEMAQIVMDHWSIGQVALVGDAAYCCSPLSGQGTGVALLGAYILAGELKRARVGDWVDHGVVFASYFKHFHDYAERTTIPGHRQHSPVARDFAGYSLRPS